MLGLSLAKGDDEREDETRDDGETDEAGKAKLVVRVAHQVLRSMVRIPPIRGLATFDLGKKQNLHFHSLARIKVQTGPVKGGAMQKTTTMHTLLAGRWRSKVVRRMFRTRSMHSLSTILGD